MTTRSNSSSRRLYVAAPTHVASTTSLDRRTSRTTLPSRARASFRRVLTFSQRNTDAHACQTHRYESAGERAGVKFVEIILSRACPFVSYRECLRATNRVSAGSAGLHPRTHSSPRKIAEGTPPPPSSRPEACTMCTFDGLIASVVVGVCKTCSQSHPQHHLLHPLPKPIGASAEKSHAKKREEYKKREAHLLLRPLSVGAANPGTRSLSAAAFRTRFAVEPGDYAVDLFSHVFDDGRSFVP